MRRTERVKSADRSGSQVGVQGIQSLMKQLAYDTTDVPEIHTQISELVLPRGYCNCFIAAPVYASCEHVMPTEAGGMTIAVGWCPPAA